MTGRIPVTFLLLDNEQYMILKWFAEAGGISSAPGLELPGLDVAAVARGYGVPASTAGDPEEIRQALREAIAAENGPRLVQVRIASGMWQQ